MPDPTAVAEREAPMSTDTITIPISIPECPSWCVADDCGFDMLGKDRPAVLVRDHADDGVRIGEAFYVFARREDLLDTRAGTFTSTYRVALGEGDQSELSLDQTRQLIEVLTETLARIEASQ